MVRLELHPSVARTETKPCAPAQLDRDARRRGGHRRPLAALPHTFSRRSSWGDLSHGDYCTRLASALRWRPAPWNTSAHLQPLCYGDLSRATTVRVRQCWDQLEIPWLLCALLNTRELLPGRAHIGVGCTALVITKVRVAASFAFSSWPCSTSRGLAGLLDHDPGPSDRDGDPAVMSSAL